VYTVPKTFALNLNLETVVKNDAAAPDDHCSELRAEQWLPLPVEKVFSFFSDAKNLEILTPPWLHFHVLGMSTPEITEGTLIDYKLRVRGIPIRWQSRIEEWRPNERFVDTQVRGPYAYWHHTHLFKPLNGGTQIVDIVRYRAPGGALGRWFVLPFVKRDIETIFRFRRDTIAARFPRK
jgi:uncharacterized protein